MKAVVVLGISEYLFAIGLQLVTLSIIPKLDGFETASGLHWQGISLEKRVQLVPHASYIADPRKRIDRLADVRFVLPFFRVLEHDRMVKVERVVPSDHLITEGNKNGSERGATCPAMI